MTTPAEIIDAVARMSPEERRTLRELLADVGPQAAPAEIVPTPRKARAAMTAMERVADELLEEFGPTEMAIDAGPNGAVYRMRLRGRKLEATGATSDEATRELLKQLRAARNRTP